MRLFIYEMIPQVWVSDGQHFIEAVFTKDAINHTRKAFSFLKFVTLRNKVIFINKWYFRLNY